MTNLERAPIGSSYEGNLMTNEIVLQALYQRAFSFAHPYLVKGRAGWDLPHSHAAAQYGLDIARHAYVDPLVMMITGLTHDIGYFGQFDTVAGGSSTYDAVTDKKKAHMTIGAAHVERFLSTDQLMQTRLNQSQRDLIVHLVGMHDALETVITPVEHAFVEADTLAQLNYALVTPTYTRNSGLAYLESVRQRRAPLFRTEWSINELGFLLPQAQEYFERKIDSTSFK